MVKGAMAGTKEDADAAYVTRVNVRRRSLVYRLWPLPHSRTTSACDPHNPVDLAVSRSTLIALG